MEIESGNIPRLRADNDWFIGFNETITGLRSMPEEMQSTGLCVKWKAHPEKDESGPTKPPSAGRSVAILVSEQGRFRFEFSDTESFAESRLKRVTLKRHGDFVIWGSDLYHAWCAETACTILTVRWIPI